MFFFDSFEGRECLWCFQGLINPFIDIDAFWGSIEDCPHFAVVLSYQSFEDDFGY